MRGFAPARRGSFARSFASLRINSGQALLFRQKDPKPLAPGRGPKGVPLPQSRLLGLRNSLRSDSPRPQLEFAGPGRSHARRRGDVACAILVIPDLIGDPASLPFYAGFRPRTTSSFCFGKRSQNHSRPGAALRVPLPQSRVFGLRNSLRSDSPRPQIELSGLRRSHARRRGDVACAILVIPDLIGDPGVFLFHAL